MKIAIGNIQNQDLFTEVDPSTGKSILGGGSIEASFELSASSNNSKGLVRTRVFGFGDDLLAGFEVNLQTGQDFSKSTSAVKITSN